MSQQTEEKQTVVTARRHKWPFVLGAVAVVAAAAVLLGGKLSGSSQVIISPTETALLVRTDLQDSVSATGTVESANSMTVYSTMAYTVQQVLVKVGDKVEAGQLLCKLDGQSIQDQIDTQQAGLNAATAASNATITSARDTYQQFKDNLEKGLNASIINAENAVTNAHNSYVAAQNTYDRYLAGIQAGENSTLLSQENALRSARNAIETAKDAKSAAQNSMNEAYYTLADVQNTYYSARNTQRQAESALEAHRTQTAAAEKQMSDLTVQKTALEQQLAECADETQQAALQAQLAQVQTGLDAAAAQLVLLNGQTQALESACAAAVTGTARAEGALRPAEQAYTAASAQYESAEKSVVNAEEAYASALKQYNAALTSVDNTLTDYAKNVENAFSAYETAQTSLAAAKTAAQNQLQTYKNNLNSAYAGAGKESTQLAIDQLRADLAGTEITAPMSGTVTAVYAEVGAAGSGLLFVIEDTDNFVISTSLKDYDIAAVQEGTPVAIRSDATGKDVYEGKITYIAPTANKNAMGMTDTTGEITFDTDVAVTSEDTRLRIGLNVRLELIVAQEKDVLAAPYDVVYENSAGNHCVLVAEEQSDGTWLLREQAVELGLETDLDIAVKADSLTEDTRVVSNPEKYVQYIGQPVVIGSGGAKTAADLRQEMMGGS